MKTKEKENRKLLLRWIIVGAILLLFVAVYVYVNKFLVEKNVQHDNVEYVSGRVVQMLQDNTAKDETVEGMLRGSQEIIVEITSGKHKGEQYMTTNYLSALFNTDAQVGTKLVLMIATKSTGDLNVTVYGYNRANILYISIAVFALFLCIIGGRKGVMALLSLVFTLICVWKLMFPMMLYGVPVLFSAILVIVFTILLTFTLIDGVNTKTISAAIGTLAGVIIAGIFGIVVGELTHISGFQTNEAEELLLKATSHGMKIKNLFIAGILISALGAVMDVAMSISSAIHEIHMVDPKITAIKLFKSGMNIGRDAMGTMANTLILAFVGSSLTMLLLIYTYQVPFIQLVNTSLVAREVIQGIAGSIGIILTVPIVAGVSAFIESKYRK